LTFLNLISQSFFIQKQMTK